MTTRTEKWTRCYETGWKGWIVPDAFSHPAKFSRCLIERIYDHAFEMGWVQQGSVVLDPFGGVALGGLCAMSMGLRWVGVELEEKFVKLGEQNIELWNKQLASLPNLGTAKIIQGDSRKLNEVVKKADLVVSSPPFAESKKGGGLADPLNPSWNNAEKKHGRKFTERSRRAAYDKAECGHTPGNLANMKEGSVDAVIGSPPFLGVNIDTNIEHGVRVNKNRQCVRTNRPKHIAPRQKAKTLSYGHSPSQLGSMKEGSFDIAISSPPYVDTPIDQTHMTSNDRGNPNNPNYRPSWRKKLAEGYASTKRPYGQSTGQLGSMTEGSFDMCVSSPPMGEIRQDGGRIAKEGVGGFGAYTDEPPEYWHTQRDQTNLGNLKTGNTFWEASREIVQQCYELLKPGGIAIWVTKDYVKNKQRVPFSDRWLALCESVGFKLVCRHKAMLSKEINGKLTEKKSFFRRLSETKIRAQNHWKTVSRKYMAKYLWKARRDAWEYYHKLQEENDPDHPPIFPTKNRVLTIAQLYSLKEYPGDVRDWDDERIIYWEEVLCLEK